MKVNVMVGGEKRTIAEVNDDTTLADIKSRIKVKAEYTVYFDGDPVDDSRTIGEVAGEGADEVTVAAVPAAQTGGNH